MVIDRLVLVVEVSGKVSGILIGDVMKLERWKTQTGQV